MVAGLVLKENDEVINGLATGAELTAILATAGIQTYAPGSAKRLSASS